MNCEKTKTASRRLVYKVGKRSAERWHAALAEALPDIEVLNMELLPPGANADYAAVWRPEPGALAKFPTLRAVISLAAGVDHLLNDGRLPRDIPIVRLTGPALVQRMVEYTTLHTLRHHRQMYAVEQSQRDARWAPSTQPPASERRVGLMGYGVLGQAAGQALGSLGFNIAAWVRSPRQIDGVEVFAGHATLTEFASRCDVIICLLPLTPDTQDILNQRLFSAMPRDSSLINVARGEHLVDADLIEALNSEHLRAATLDVFRQEPLPVDHMFWSHPRILVTPHVASLIDADTGARLVAEHIRRFEMGEHPENLVDLQRGY